MRKLIFREPTFVCEVARAGQPSKRLEYGASQDEVRTRLEQRGYTVASIKPYQFTKWRTLAEKNLKGFSPATKPYTFNADVWTEIKQFLYALSNDLCGYCESEVFTTAHGAVEHYRPKSAVEGDPKHPGYYWLAYDIDNYIPTCDRCNTGKGKRNQFPVKGKRIRKPKDSLKKEKPLLLHPFKHDPRKHLRFLAGSPDGKLAAGFVDGVDVIGQTSIRVYQLNREHLAVARQKAVESLRLELNQAAQDLAKSQRLIAQIVEGNRPYASTCLAVVTAWLNEQQAAIDSLRQKTGQSVPIASRQARKPTGRRRSSR